MGSLPFQPHSRLVATSSSPIRVPNCEIIEIKVNTCSAGSFATRLVLYIALYVVSLIAIPAGDVVTVKVYYSKVILPNQVQ